MAYLVIFLVSLYEQFQIQNEEVNMKQKNYFPDWLQKPKKELICWK